MDPLMLMVFGGIAFVAMCFFLLVAFVIWVRYRRVPRASLGFAGAAFVVLILAIVSMPPGYDEDEVRRVRRLGAELAPRLEAYRREHGVYPPTLQAAGVATPETKYGPLQYGARRDSAGVPSYEFSVGDYFQNGFVAFWDNAAGHDEWNVDS